MGHTLRVLIHSIMSLWAGVFMSLIATSLGGHLIVTPYSTTVPALINPSTSATNQTRPCPYMSLTLTSASSTVICSPHSASVIGWFISIMDLMRIVIYTPRERAWRNTCIPVIQEFSLLGIRMATV